LLYGLLYSFFFSPLWQAIGYWLSILVVQFRDSTRLPCFAYHAIVSI